MGTPSLPSVSPPSLSPQEPMRARAFTTESRAPLADPTEATVAATPEALVMRRAVRTAGAGGGGIGLNVTRVSVGVAVRCRSSSGGAMEADGDGEGVAGFCSASVDVGLGVVVVASVAAVVVVVVVVICVTFIVSDRINVLLDNDALMSGDKRSRDKVRPLVAVAQAKA